MVRLLHKRISDGACHISPSIVIALLCTDCGNLSSTLPALRTTRPFLSDTMPRQAADDRAAAAAVTPEHEVGLTFDARF